jgi:hypothetical protein
MPTLLGQDWVPTEKTCFLDRHRAGEPAWGECLLELERSVSCHVVVYKMHGGKAPFLRQEEKLLSFPRAADSILLKTACG